MPRIEHEDITCPHLWKAFLQVSEKAMGKMGLLPLVVRDNQHGNQLARRPEGRASGECENPGCKKIIGVILRAPKVKVFKWEGGEVTAYSTADAKETIYVSRDKCLRGEQVKY